VDLNRLAHKLVEKATDEDREPENPRSTAGRKGGAARAKSLTPERRSEIAKKAAEARWRSR
jgi:general stress protein YciG